MSPPKRKSIYRIGEAELTVIYADITTISADVIVSSDDNFLTMGGGVSYSIRKKGGRTIEEEVKKHIPANLGDVVVTSAGDLDAKYVLHGITIDLEKWEFASNKDLSSIVLKAIKLADSLGQKSISFPALGTGAAGFPFQLAAQTMTLAIIDCLSKPTIVNKVNLCLHSWGGAPWSDLNFFYEISAGIASTFAQVEHLGSLLNEITQELSKHGNQELINRITSMRAKVSVVDEGKSIFNKNEPFFNDQTLNFSFSDLANDLSLFTVPEKHIIEERNLELKLLETKLSGLYTTLNIKQSQLNSFLIEEAKYGGQMIPPRLKFAIEDIRQEMKEAEMEVKKIRMRQVDLGM